MESLLERFRRIRKEMASALTELCLDPGETKVIKEAVELYDKLTQEALKVSALINTGTVSEEDRQGIRKLEEQVDSAWLKLSEPARKELIEMLLVKKMLPEDVGVALRIFDGKVVSLV